MKRATALAILLLVVSTVWARPGRPSTATQRLAEKADRESTLGQSVWGFCAVNMAGDTLVWLNADRRMMPASNLKLITTGAALLQLGGDFEFGTTFATDGPVQDSVLLGNLYIIGGGDPMIGNIFPYLPEPEQTFGEWSKLLADNGIVGIGGDIVGVGSHFAAEQYHTDWSAEDARTRDGVVPGGLTWRGKMGDSIPDGPYPAALHYKEWLDTNGFCVGGCARTLVEGDTPEDSLTVLGRVPSLPLRGLVSVANRMSDNFIAETLIKELGKRLAGSDDYAASTAALHKALSPLGLAGASASMRFADGSGLSRKNYVTPGFMVSFLRGMARRGSFADFKNSLPYPGERKTTLQNRMPKVPGSIRTRIRMKSGSMNGVRCFSGYVFSPDGKSSQTIAFSLFTNNVTASSSVVFPLIDSFLESLARENN